MRIEEATALAPGARLEWNRGDAWLPVVYLGRSPRRSGWFAVRHERMGWTHDGPPEDLRHPDVCPTCGRPRP